MQDNIHDVSGIEAAIRAIKRLQTNTLDSTASGIG
jgi:hypothetical protein